MLSDNGTEFVGGAFEEMLREEGIENLSTQLYIPSSNGLVEVTVRTLKELLRMCWEKVNDWNL